MKLKIDVKKGAEVFSETVQKTSEISKKLSNSVQEKAKDLSDKNRNENYIKRLKKYNPLFPERFYSEEFNLPNMIIIVDDAVRRGIDVCEGAIGWLSDEKGMEVLHLYDEEVKNSGIQFIPAPICDAVYYVDRFDRNRFIQTENIFSKAQEERLAELKHIAHALGAKRCSIEISESTEVSQKSKKAFEEKIKIPFGKISEGFSAEMVSSNSNSAKMRGTIEAVFEGSSEVSVPKLKWFANDDTIKKLIEMRMDETNRIKSEELVLDGAASATMSQKTACAIDGAIGKIGVGGKTDFESMATKEHHSRLVFKIEF